ncbi:DnaJ-domain-containing protein [Annulohypoxylon moriforme]|nr:DnaJ-domain-containing protein [Annulohypoxylon moriforme]
MLHTTNRKRKDRFDFYQEYINQNISTESSKMVQPKFPKHDLYKTLGVESNASLDDIKKAYRELCKKVHPDKAEGGNTPENNEKFAQVQEAWEILRDEVLRREYNQYRANSAKDSSHRDDKDGDSGRRHRERRERKERSERSGKKHNPRGSARPKTDRTHSNKEDTYEPKPNRSRKPYYEDWSESDHRDGSKSYGSGPQPGSWHYGAPPFYGSGGPPPPPPPPPPQYSPYDRQHRPHSARGPPQVKLEDRILAMRIRVDLNQSSRELDNLQADFKSFVQSFQAQFNFADAEKARWRQMFEDVSDAIEFLEDMYDAIHTRLESVETGFGRVMMTLDLPELMGILQAHITRVKYSLTAALIILGQLSGYLPYEAEQHLLHTLEGRLDAMQHCTKLNSSWTSF